MEEHVYEGDYEGADFSGANLRKALFDGDANFTCANFTGANIELAEIFSDFSRANFTNANLKMADFCESRLEGAIFYGADLAGATFSEAHVTGADFGQHLPECLDLSGAYAGPMDDPERLVLTGKWEQLYGADPPTYRLETDNEYVFYRNGKWADSEAGLG